ncbi:PH domain-containing protein [Mycoplasma putrefaciens]|uniref:PH domain-containing protein n=1 Tax=Mycoplasma putrefaciens TaxID=2123 RepID=UPI003DA57D87
MKTKQQIINDLKTNLSDHIDLIDKKEFESLVKFFFDNEEIVELLVVGIENQAWLITLTNQRIFFVKKHNLYNNIIQQYGLEQLKDLRLSSLADQANLSFILNNDQTIRAEEISLNQAQSLAKKIARAHISWMSEINNKVIKPK